MMIDQKEFWNNKILDWESGRYGLKRKKTRSSLMELLADRSSKSLRFRMKICGELLRPFVKGKRIMEIGCGSGLLARQFISAGAVHYLGIDIAETAIAAARDRTHGLPDRGMIEFQVGGLADVPEAGFDIVISLGLLDWLSNDEIDLLFKKTGKADFLHTIAEKQFSIFQLMHRIYVRVSYGYRTQGYVPRYHLANDIVARARSHFARPYYAYRDPCLSFNALISSLPIGDEITP